MQGSDFATRLRATRSAAGDHGIDAILVTPGPDLTYLVGYEAIPLERLTRLVIPVDGDPVLAAPRLELLAAQASGAGALGMPIHTSTDTDDPYALVRSIIPAPAGSASTTTCGPRRCSPCGPRCWTPSRYRRRGPVGPADAQGLRGASRRWSSPGRRSTACTSGCRGSVRSHRARGRCRHRGGDPRRGTRHGRLRHRGERTERRQPAP